MVSIFPTQRDVKNGIERDRKSISIQEEQKAKLTKVRCEGPEKGGGQTSKCWGQFAAHWQLFNKASFLIRVQSFVLGWSCLLDKEQESDNETL